MTPQQFLDELWGKDFSDEFPDHRIVLWSMPGKATAVFSSSSDAAAAAETLAQAHDVYTGVCAVNATHNPCHGRGTKDDMTLACGIWADLDFGTCHKKKVPPSLDAALGLLKGLPFQPSVLVHSGHGLHSWWLLGRPEAIPDPIARGKLESAAKGWQSLLAAAAKAKGWEIDRTADCTRVLRVAGTVNRKDPRDILPVRVIHSGGKRTSSIDEFLQFCPTEDKSLQLEIASVTFVLKPDAFPNPDKFDALRENDTKFRHTWEHKRKDLDTSGSGYEQSLSSQAVRYGWTDQEVADLIIAHRRKWEPSAIAKVMRQDYVARTLQRARSSSIDSTPEKDLVMAAVAADVQPVAGGVDDLRAKLDHLGSAFGGIDLDAVIGYGREETAYFLRCRGQTEDISIGTDQNLRDPHHIRMAILKATNGQKIMRTLKQPAWLEILRIFFQVVNFEDIPESTAAGRFQVWFDLYMNERRVHTDEDFIDGFLRRDPIMRNGELWINASTLASFVEIRFGEKVRRKDLHVELKRAGFKTMSKSARVEGKVMSQRYWIRAAQESVDVVNSTDDPENEIPSRGDPISKS